VQTGSADSDQRFACILRDLKVADGRVVDGAHLDALAAQPANWALPQ
jgi:hypothetical protein